jgi:hypothetical protein
MGKPNGRCAPDPLLAALIDKLPPTGTAWPAEARAAWLQMMWMAFGVVYGAPGDTPVELPAFLSFWSSPTAQAPPRHDEPAAPRTPAPPGPRYLIDGEGFARLNTGERIMPSDVGSSIVYDARGELGDLGAIVWADGSRGVAGLRLEISTSL